MISLQSFGRARNFVHLGSPHNPAIDIAHDDGTVSTLEINYRWRPLISGLLSFLIYESNWTGTDEEIFDTIQFAQALLNDLYD